MSPRTRTSPRIAYVALASTQGSSLCYAAACFDQIIRVGRLAPEYIVGRLRKSPPRERVEGPVTQLFTPSELIFAVTEAWGHNLVLNVALSKNEEFAGKVLDRLFLGTGMVGSVRQVRVPQAEVWETIRQCSNQPSAPTDRKPTLLGPAVRAVLGMSWREVEGLRARAAGLLLATLPGEVLAGFLTTARATSEDEKESLDKDLMQVLGVPLQEEPVSFCGGRDPGYRSRVGGIE